MQKRGGAPKRESVCGKAEPNRTSGGKAAKLFVGLTSSRFVSSQRLIKATSHRNRTTCDASSHELTSNCERKQCRLNRSENSFEKNYRLRSSRCWSWFRFLKCHHTGAVCERATKL